VIALAAPLAAHAQAWPQKPVKFILQAEVTDS
jgi:hypothetical protein